MVGFVTTRHLLTHSTVIIQEFGARCFLRCIWRTLTSEGDVTFLECVARMPRRVARMPERAGVAMRPTTLAH